jgi:hypothetical protein
MANKKSATTAESKEVVKREEAGVPALAEEFAALSGQGFEDTDKDAFAIPFLRVLQGLSPQVDENDPAYVEGAKQGMFINTITNVLFGKVIEVIPVHYMRDFVEWAPNRGGFIKAHGPDPAILSRVTKIDDHNNQILDNGNVIQDTRNHYVLIADQLNLGPIIFSLTSTGIRHSRKWMTLLNALIIPGTEKRAPMFAGVWELSTILNENDDGKWYQVGNKTTTCIKFNEWVTKEQLAAAVEARKLLMSGKAKADYESTIDNQSDSTGPPREPGDDGGDDTPF